MRFLSPALTTYFLFLTTLTGLCAGSFCNAWAWRLARGESIVRGRSHCGQCGHPLSTRDLVPLVSYLWIHGHCRYCGVRISRRYPATELLSAVFFVSVALRLGLTEPLVTLRFLLMGCLLLVLALVDYETKEIPNRLLIALGLLSLLRLPIEGWHGALDGLVGSVAVAVPLLFFVLLADRVTGRETMGGGDIKLFFVLGLHFGPPGTLLLLIVSCLVGILLGLVMQRDQCRGQIPFAPAVAVAFWLVVLFNRIVLDWYFSLFV